METLDVQGVGPEGIQHLERLIKFYRHKDQVMVKPKQITKRRVDPSEFIVRDSKLKAPYSRTVAYEGD